jgi:hypothetical protein
MTPPQGSLPSYESALTKKSSWQTKISWIESPNQLDFYGYIRPAGKSYPVKKECYSTKVSQSFNELVQIVGNYSFLPKWTQMPHIMNFPEFYGYHWYYRLMRHPLHFGAEYSEARQDLDSMLFRAIVVASSRTGRPALCAPDYFLYSKEESKREVKRIFKDRTKLFDGKWNLSISMEQLEHHTDWTNFLHCVKNELLAGE